MIFTRLLEHPASLAVLMVLIVVLLSWKKLPDMARSMGRSARILKSEADELKNENEVRKQKYIEESKIKEKPAENKPVEENNNSTNSSKL